MQVGKYIRLQRRECTTCRFWGHFCSQKTWDKCMRNDFSSGTWEKHLLMSRYWDTAFLLVPEFPQAHYFQQKLWTHKLKLQKTESPNKIMFMKDLQVDFSGRPLTAHARCCSSQAVTGKACCIRLLADRHSAMGQLPRHNTSSHTSRESSCASDDITSLSWYTSGKVCQQ